jgi:hypothetical protein
MLTEGRTVTMVTTQQPLFPLLVTLLAIGGGTLSVWFGRHRFSCFDLALVLAMVLLIIGLVQPWWVLDGEGATLEVVSNVFLLPADMVTLGQGPGVANGEVASVPTLFTTMLHAVVVLSVSGIVTIIVARRLRSRWLYLVPVGALAGSLVIFTLGMGTAAEIITGDFWGSGALDLSVPGSPTVRVAATWAPSTGYFLTGAALILVLAVLLAHLGLVPKRLIRA